MPFEYLVKFSVILNTYLSIWHFVPSRLQLDFGTTIIIAIINDEGSHFLINRVSFRQGEIDLILLSIEDEVVTSRGEQSIVDLLQSKSLTEKNGTAFNFVLFEEAIGTTFCLVVHRFPNTPLLRRSDTS